MIGALFVVAYWAVAACAWVLTIRWCKRQVESDDLRWDDGDRAFSAVWALLPAIGWPVTILAHGAFFVLRKVGQRMVRLVERIES